MTDSIGQKAAHVRAEVRKSQTRPHVCHAEGCSRKVPPALFMCKDHWRMVPVELQKAIWKHYQAGQEKGEAPVSRAYLETAKAAIEAVRKADPQAKLPL